MVKIISANKDCLGPCFGIKRALEGVSTIKNKNEFLIYGKLGHNEILCNYLEKIGLFSIDDLKKSKNQDKDKNKDKKIIVRAHGISKKDLDYLKKKKISFIDLTCPFVGKLLNTALRFEKLGYQIIILGSKDHIEIKNVCSFLKKPKVVDNKKEAEKLPFFSKVAVLTQTTQTLDKIKEVIPILKKKYPLFVYVETRCPETEKRQNEAFDLAKKTGLVLVIGDKISKNANNLVDICKKITKAKLILKPSNLQEIDLTGIKKIGIIASASTPNFVVEDVMGVLKRKKANL